jgi:hypothetical protein
MIPNYLSFVPGTDMFVYLGWGTFGLALVIFLVLSISLYYHWFVYESKSNIVRVGAVFYAAGSLIILLNVWLRFSHMMS